MSARHALRYSLRQATMVTCVIPSVPRFRAAGHRISCWVVMRQDKDKRAATPSEKGLISRFLFVLYGQGVEAIGGMAFFLYLARLDSTIYGEVMYALAAGAVVTKLVQFGLYYPLVRELSAAERDKAPEILYRVNLVKVGLMIAAMTVLCAFLFVRGFSFRMGWVLFFVALGHGLESLSETFFADMRVRGRQATESRIRVVGSTFSYLYGFGTAWLGLDPLLISLFKVISGLARLAGGLVEYLRHYGAHWFINPGLRSLWLVLRAASVFALIEVLGLVFNRTNVLFLESALGIKAVAYYSATYNLIDPVSNLMSQQLLGWVVFPLLATLWWQEREKLAPFLRRSARWLMCTAFPVMFFLHAESRAIIGLIYPSEYSDAIWMQQYLVWTILLSFENNLFSYVMMVIGAARVLLAFAALTTTANLVMCVTLMGPYGLTGACLVIILSKLVMTLLTYGYCQFRLNIFKWGDFVFPVVLALASVVLFCGLQRIVTLQPAILGTMGFYMLILWKIAPGFIGPAPGSKEALQAHRE